jgi:hypothetical protein
MQDKYTGDIGDFSKLGILRVLENAGLSIGLNWYMNLNESHNSDGRHVEYLSRDSFKVCDEELWLELKDLVDHHRRQVCYLEKKGILRAGYFSECLDFKGKTKSERESFRKKWHERALTALSGKDIVFADPDNGLVVPSAEKKPKENKYVLPDELADYYAQHSSVIYYQHKARKPDEFYVRQHDKLIHSQRFPNAKGLALKFIRTSQRYYFFIIQPRHQMMIEKAIDEMLATAWNQHFESLNH